MKKAVRWLIGLLLLLPLMLLLPISSVYAQVPNRPRESTVLDETNSLSPETIQAIDRENRAWKATNEQLQVGVYMTTQLTGDIESLANEVFRKWQVGFAGSNNGVLVVIALEDRKFRIETSDRAATVLTDVTSRRILESARHFFRKDDYNGGVRYIVDAIGDAFYGTDRAQARMDELEEEQDEDNPAYFLLPVFIVVVVMILISKGGGRGGRGGRGGDRDILLWLLLNSFGNSNNHSHSSDSSGFGGGGWSGGGGGGGGASSGW
ncbi:MULTISPECIES: YgcG family protein [unclassified Streptococcus]|uniref:TPM domain-containing protein n=1 Tax=unclassified Streptococcus TaxID=2608887 RepID=UPI001072D255|nr:MULTISPECIES: TPM domain-containing protein [unclassified Streptococcus]MBF0786488.1 TPM domain-containing protein [Streptococcus sp. 19428wC2_LYSM12]MCQ9212356.1 TPM domain-containing protein [Streptococcus sp. B01]MCQ9213687.1 TPM domain-containing protein [Streptococcus sp. O1]TFV06652.1 TPM domain-containing protein [Streptococcus sp. LYSM12]